MRLDSPIGRIELSSDGHAITRVSVEREGELPNDDLAERPTAVLTRAARQLREYFEGERRSFELPIVVEGTPFQHSVWRALGTIPFGSAVTYGQLAYLAGHEGSPRAVGAAIAANPLPLLIPCHRVLDRKGRLTGYSVGEGLPVKQWLLVHERIEFRD